MVFFLYVKAQADISALICDIISKTASSLCCAALPGVGAAFLFMPTVTHHHFHIPARRKQGQRMGGMPLPFSHAAWKLCIWLPLTSH